MGDNSWMEVVNGLKKIITKQENEISSLREENKRLHVIEKETEHVRIHTWYFIIWTQN